MGALLPVRLSSLRRWTGEGGRPESPGSSPTAEPQIGVDLVAVSRLRQVFEGNGELLEAVFTAEERRYSGRQRRPFMHLAARFAAKEAVLKGLGTGLTAEMTWRDIETVHGPRGEPRLILSGEVARLAGARGLHRCAVSLSHAGDYAVAAVLFAA